MEYRIATKKDLETIWNKDIKSHPTDARWQRWKTEYINYNKNGEVLTFVCVNNGEPVGQINVLFSPKCKAVLNKPLLCNEHDVANLNAFRIEKQFEGQGHISKLLKLAEQHCKQKGIKALTIGVEANETRNLAIYLHWGYNQFVMHEIDKDENNALVLYYKKELQ